MAAASQSFLRRWKHYFGAFGAIDDAIDAAGHLRDEFRSSTGKISELIRIAEDDGVAEKLCLVLDDIMVDYLLTLQTMPVKTSDLASTGLAKAVGVLTQHTSAKIRGHARDVVGKWRAAVQGDLTSALDRAKAAMDVLNKMSDEQIPPPVAAEEEKNKAPATKTSSVRISCVTAKSAPVVDVGCASSVVLALPAVVEDSKKKRTPPKKASIASSRVEPPKYREAAAAKKTPQPQMPSTKTPTAVRNRDGDLAGRDKMEATTTKRKVREDDHQIEDDAKRQRKMHVHPIMRERGRDRYGSSTAVRRS